MLTGTAFGRIKTCEITNFINPTAYTFPANANSNSVRAAYINVLIPVRARNYRRRPQ
jgi:hypothetical protein